MWQNILLRPQRSYDQGGPGGGRSVPHQSNLSNKRMLGLQTGPAPPAALLAAPTEGVDIGLGVTRFAQQQLRRRPAQQGGRRKVRKRGLGACGTINRNCHAVCLTAQSVECQSVGMAPSSSAYGRPQPAAIQQVHEAPTEHCAQAPKPLRLPADTTAQHSPNAPVSRQPHQPKVPTEPLTLSPAMI